MKLTRTPAGLAATVMLAVTLAACGGGKGNATDSDDDEIASLGTTATPDGTAAPDGTAPEDTTVDAPEDPEEAMLAYTECMRDQGIDMPDPVTNEDGAHGAFVVVDGSTADGDREDFVAAEKECAPLLEAAMSGIEADPELQAELRESMLEFTECMRAQGIDMPDPVFNEDGGGLSVEMDAVEGAAPMEAGEVFEPDPEMEAAAEECGGPGSVMAATPVGGGG